MNKYYLWMLAGILFFCGASYFLYTQVSVIQSHQDVDSKAYLANAQLFYQNNSFVWPNSASGNYPYYTLGYAFILGLLFKLFGSNDWVIIFVQLLVSLISLLLIFDIAKKIAGPQAALIAYIFACINLGFIIFSQFILAEIWLTFFLLLFFHRFITFLSNKDIVVLAQAALALSISVLIKPAALYYWPLLLPCFWICSTYSFKRFLSFCLVWCFVFYAPLAAYSLHNKFTFNRWYICELDHENMVYWFFPNVLAHKYSTDQNYERSQLRLLSQSQAHEKFMQELLQSPHLFVIVWLKNVAKTWVGLFVSNLKVLVEQDLHGGDISYFKTKGSLIQRAHAYVNTGTKKQWIIALGYFEVVWSLIRLALCFAAILLLMQTHQWLLIYLIVTYLAYFSLITGHDGCARFRMLFEWLLIIMAALGVLALKTFFQKKPISKKS